MQPSNRNFVLPEQEYVAPSPLPEEHSFQRHVMNPVLQNLFAGLGVAILARWLPEIVYHYLGWEYGQAGENRIPILWGVIFFGFLCVLRFSQDEVTAIVTKVAVKLYDIKLSKDISTQIDYYEGRIVQLGATITDLKAQVEVYGGVTVNNPLTHADIAERKMLALKLYTRMVNGLNIARDECMRVGVFESRADWTLAKHYLVDAGVIDRSGKPVVGSVNQGTAMIESYAQTLAQTRLAA